MGLRFRVWGLSCEFMVYLSSEVRLSLVFMVQVSSGSWLMRLTFSGLALPVLGFMIYGCGFRTYGSGFRAWGCGFGADGLGSRVRLVYRAEG